MDKPAGISYIVPCSLHEKSTLRHNLERWRGRAFTATELQGFDLAKLLGAMCMLGLKANTKGKTVVDTINSVPKGTPKVEPFNPLSEWSVSNGKDKAFELLPEFIRKMAMASVEWAKVAAPAAPLKPLASAQPDPAFQEAEEEPMDETPF